MTFREKMKINGMIRSIVEKGNAFEFMDTNVKLAENLINDINELGNEDPLDLKSKILKADELERVAYSLKYISDLILCKAGTIRTEAASKIIDAIGAD